MYGIVVEATAAEALDVLVNDIVGVRRQLFGETAKLAIRSVEVSLSPVPGKSSDQGVGLGVGEFSGAGDLSPEIVGVGADSVDAVIARRDHHGQHLALRARQSRGAVHDAAVEPHGIAQHRGVATHDADDFPNSSGTAAGFVVLRFERPRRALGRDNLYSRQPVSPPAADDPPFHWRGFHSS